MKNDDWMKIWICFYENDVELFGLNKIELLKNVLELHMSNTDVK